MKNVLARKRPDVLIIPELFHANRAQDRIRGVVLCPKGLLSSAQCPPDIELDERELFIDIGIGEYCSSQEVEAPCFSLPSVDPISYGDNCPNLNQPTDQYTRQQGR
jgi:hypothetical protein